MRILHVYRTYFPDPQGGLQEAIRQLCLALQPLGFENQVFTLSPRPNPAIIQRPEAEVIRCRSWAAPASCDLGGPASLRSFRRAVQGADIVHYHAPWPFADILHVLSGSLAPAVLTYHSDIVRQRFFGKLYRPLMMRTLRSMAAIVATSPDYARTSPVLSDPSLCDIVHVVPLGVDRASYPAVGNPEIVERLGLADGEPFFLFIGVLRYYKGLHSLIRAAGAMNARIVIAGSGPEGGALRQLATQIGAGNVVFAGQISDVEKVTLLSACRALVLPSHLRSEAYGMVLVEAAMYARPMICCQIGTGTSYINVHGETGLVVAPNDPQALAGAMNQLLKDPALANRMGEAARLRYERLFSGEVLGRAYSALFRDVAG